MHANVWFEIFGDYSTVKTQNIWEGNVTTKRDSNWGHMFPRVSIDKRRSDIKEVDVVVFWVYNMVRKNPQKHQRMDENVHPWMQIYYRIHVCFITPMIVTVSFSCNFYKNKALGSQIHGKSWLLERENMW